MDVFQAMNAQCEKLKSPSYTELVISIIILIGILFSYMTQHYRIIARGTSEGISPYFVLLGTTSATAGFANILTVPPSREAISCCRELESFECAAGLLGVAQLGTQWLCFALILILFLIFFNYKATSSGEELEDQPAGWRTAAAVGLVCIFHGLVVIIISGVFFIAVPRYLNGWANFLGVMAAVLAGIQYLPQIYTTYRLKHVGSLSIPMMCIQTPGGLLFAASLFARLGWEGWSTWVIYVLSAAMQGTILGMAIYYELQTRRRETAQVHWQDSAPGSPTERSSSQRRPQTNRTYSEGWERGLPGPFTGHPERYAETEEDLEHIVDREERAIARENQPLLKPGGIGHPYKSYDSTGN